jgi:cytochrome c556
VTGLVLWSRSWGMAVAMAASLVAPPAWAQDQSAATTKDVIFARKTLMNSVMENMDRIAEMISQGAVDLRLVRKDADNIAALFAAFPQLFPPESNQWMEGADLDPVTDTVASPDVWSNFADFKMRATAAGKTAYELSRADNEGEVRRLNRALGNACDTCHSLYLKE